MADNSFRQTFGVASVDNSTKTADVLAAVTGGRNRLISVHTFVTAAGSGGTPIVTLRDGTGGTILAQYDGTKTAAYDFDYHDGIGYPLTVGNSLSLEVSGASTQASVTCNAVGFVVRG